jgi:hypothetical protein
MDLLESAALAYITAPPWRFIHPQFNLPYRDRQGGSCPDFVALDFKMPMIFIVEVTGSYDLNTLCERVKIRRTRWYEPLQAQLAMVAKPVADWSLRTAVFVRGDRYKAARAALSEENDVSVIAVEAILRSWAWNWEDKAYPLNPLDQHSPPPMPPPKDAG